MPDGESLSPTDDSPNAVSHSPQSVITLAPSVAARVQQMGDELGGIAAAEVVRRGLILLDLLLSLEECEELVVRNDQTDGYERLAFRWDEL